MAKRRRKKARARKPKVKPEYQKQRADVYTMMLVTSFLALVLGSVLLHLENERYNYDFEAKTYKTDPVKPSP